MSKRPFHHGNLRAELLQRAEVVLRERGAEALSLRELARDIGVSHGAPRSHFIDRSALLDALAERGFDTLVERMHSAAKALPTEPVGGAEILRAVGRAYLDFAIRNPALEALMVAAKVGGQSLSVQDAAMRLVSAMSDVVATAVDSQAYNPEEIARLTLLLSATVQGICALVVSKRIEAEQGDTLLDDAILVFMAGAVAVQPVRTVNGSSKEVSRASEPHFFG